MVWRTSLLCSLLFLTALAIPLNFLGWQPKDPVKVAVMDADNVESLLPIIASRRPRAKVRCLKMNFNHFTWKLPDVWYSEITC
ncbi:hypothetical protein QR680_015942 [Steinernema hermaphroditum]|uniref:Uncharacterized protein n=1 Tax=Steinernema hermaphroditum TaxID=289476 RepID=A0AA39HBD7_9BILA|nr:hypothetical protein QR680_015942 [Steinernema hermaphroditum]